MASWRYESRKGKEQINLRPGAAREKFNAFFVKQSFFSRDLPRFWSLRYPEGRGLGWQGHTCVKNLPQVRVEVCTIWWGLRSGGSRVKEGHR